MKPTVTLTIRKRSSGHKLVALAVDSLDHAWTIANVLVRSVEYARCFAVATSWDGSELFSVGFSPAPSPAYPAPAYAPAIPPSNPYPLPPGSHSVPNVYRAEVIEAEPVSHAAPQLPPRRW